MENLKYTLKNLGKLLERKGAGLDRKRVRSATGEKEKRL
jgi:hypothetical protein